jgi:glycosyltransferase involved in cell wall biosynthesis
MLIALAVSIVIRTIFGSLSSVILPQSNIYCDKLKHVTMVEITVAIVTMDRPEILKDTLEQLEDCGINSAKLVIDGSSDDLTKEVCESFDVQYYRQESKGMTAARNEALNHCDTDYIAFIDDDSHVSDSWHEALKENFQKDDVVGVTGKLENEDADFGGLSGKTRSFLFGGKSYFGEILDNGVINGDFFFDEEKEVDHMPGCNMAYDVEALKTQGGFDEKIDVGNSYREDTIASYRISQAGKVIYNPGVSVDHLGVEESGDLRKWMFYNPYNTRYFLRDYGIVSGFRNLLSHMVVTFVRHVYFAAGDLPELERSYLNYLCGEVMGFWDFVLHDRDPRGVL